MGKTANKKKGTARSPAAPRLRVVPDAPPPQVKPPKLSQKELREQDATQLVNSETADTSFVIVDYDELRAAAIEAMNAVDSTYVEQSTGVQKKLDDWKKRKISAAHTHVFLVHPLDLVVSTGPERLNPRDFSTPDMIARVAEMTDMCAGGVNVPLRVSPMNMEATGGRLTVVAGDTRLRAVLHGWILKARDPNRSVPKMIPIMLESPGTNDAKRLLDVVLDNEQVRLEPIAVATNYLAAVKKDMTVEEVAAHVGQPVSKINGMLAMLEMPEAVLNLIRAGTIKASLASKWWDESGKNAEKLLTRITAADRLRKAVGATHVMPKHDAGPSSAEAEGGSGTGDAGEGGSGTSETTSGGTKSTSGSGTRRISGPQGVDNALKRTLDMVAQEAPQWKVEGDGFVTWTHKLTVEAAMSIAQRLGWVIPEELKDAA